MKLGVKYILISFVDGMICIASLPFLGVSIILHKWDEVFLASVLATGIWFSILMWCVWKFSKLGEE
jgi:hypothetical protein